MGPLLRPTTELLEVLYQFSLTHVPELLGQPVRRPAELVDVGCSPLGTSRSTGTSDSRKLAICSRNSRNLDFDGGSLHMQFLRVHKMSRPCKNVPKTAGAKLLLTNRIVRFITSGVARPLQPRRHTEMILTSGEPVALGALERRPEMPQQVQT